MSARIQRVSIVGAGAMGGMYAEHFANAGFEVQLVARGERASRLRADGLVVNGQPVKCQVVDVDRPDTVEPTDLLLFAVKDRQLEQAMDDAAGLVGPATIMLSIVNGLDSEERIAARFGPERVLLCVALGMDAAREGSSVRYRQPGRLLVGRETNAEPFDPLVGTVQEALTRAGLAWQTPADMRHEIWWKFMANSGVNQASAVLRAPYGPFAVDTDARNLMLALMDEVILVANAEGVRLGPDDVAEWEKVVAAMPPQASTSMRQDVEAGRETEVESFAGRTVALGARHGIATPYNQAMLWILRYGATAQ